MPKFYLDGEEIEFQKEDDILSAALRHKKFIPHYCAHEGLSRVATCRMCMVEVVDAGNGRALPKLQTACSTPVQEGMKVVTKNDKVKQAREAVMEFLLVNHPLDCPICDQSGECELQNFSFEYGTGKSLVKHEKRVYGWRDIGSFLQLERNRCIHCTRCVRFTQEVSGTHKMGVFGRNYQLSVDTFIDYPLSDNYQGNLADICPVGAITTKDFRFKNRVWLEKQTPSICNGCSSGCNINVCHYRGQVFRFLPRENMEVNKWWMCDKGRLSFHPLVDKKQRQVNPLYKKEKISWDSAMEKVKEQIAHLTPKSKVLIVASNHSTNEELASLKAFADKFLPQAILGRIPKVKVQKKPNARFIETLFTEDKTPNSNGVTQAGFTYEISKKLQDKDFDFVLVMGHTFSAEWFLHLLSTSAFVWHISFLKSVLTTYADLVMPSLTHLEKKGTMVNKNNLSQTNNPVIPVMAGKSEVVIFDELEKALSSGDSFQVRKVS
jgi:NADH-quinone oxidoreductase subunit G